MSYFIGLFFSIVFTSIAIGGILLLLDPLYGTFYNPFKPHVVEVNNMEYLKYRIRKFVWWKKQYFGEGLYRAQWYSHPIALSRVQVDKLMRLLEVKKPKKIKEKRIRW